MDNYHHRQFGTLVAVIFALTLIMLVTLLIFVEMHPVGIAVFVFLLVLYVLFSTLSVDVSSKEIMVRFGPGLIRKRFPTDAVRKARHVRNSWYFGWGVRWLPGCWLYNVSGLDSVEITLGNGKRYRIGTDEPEKLLAAINEACGID